MADKFFDSIYFYVLELKCVIYLLINFFISPFFLVFFRGRNIWVIGENFGDCLKDNGYCFFKYCSELNNNIQVYFVINKNSKNFDEFLKSSKNVLLYGSFRHVLYLIFAQTFIYTHTHRDIFFHRFFPLAAIGKKLVFLQHGVTGFKKFNEFYQEHCNEMDFFVVVSDFEKNIVHNKIGVNRDKIEVTGFARYDFLDDKAKKNKEKQILYIPTWRDWMSDDNFLTSEFFVRVTSLLKSDELKNILIDKDICFKLRLHKKMEKYESAFASDSDKIKIIKFGEESVQNLISNSNLMITDYSSVCWDFYYLNKPVIFYQFDLSEYLNNRGSYLDFNTEIFGARTDSENNLVGIIENVIADSWQVDKKYLDLKSKYFKYYDSKNCERIYQKIVSLQ